MAFVSVTQSVVPGCGDVTIRDPVRILGHNHTMTNQMDSSISRMKKMRNGNSLIAAIRADVRAIALRRCADIDIGLRVV